MAEFMEVAIRMMQNYNAWRSADEVANATEELGASSETGAIVEAGATYVPAVVAFGLLVAYIQDVDQKARDDIKNDNFASGFSQGLVTGLLHWKWRQVVDLFGRQSVLHVYQRPELNELRTVCYNIGLSLGYHHAATLTAKDRAAYLALTRKASGAKAGNWDRNDQISFVIALAAAFRKRFMDF
jgi:hypothetical protein